MLEFFSTVLPAPSLYLHKNYGSTLVSYHENGMKQNISATAVK